jgi:hypothetical protein
MVLTMVKNGQNVFSSSSGSMLGSCITVVIASLFWVSSHGRYYVLFLNSIKVRLREATLPLTADDLKCKASLRLLGEKVCTSNVFCSAP